MSAPATFATFTTSGGALIYRLPLEAFPKFQVYVYLVCRDDTCVLIDAGSGTDVSHANLMDGLQQVGVKPSELTHILLTHAHIDHYGGLSRLRPLTQAKLGVHPLDVQTVAHHEARTARIGRRLASFLAETGLAEEPREQLLNIYRFTKGICQSTPVDFTLDQAFGPFEFIHLPGHCPGHVAIRVDDIVFCGDMVVEGVTPHLSPESIGPYSGLDHYLDSLSKLQAWAKDARLILNGHDDAITDLPGRIEQTRLNTVRRMRKAVEALADPLTIEQVCRAVYGDAAGYNLLLVIEKTGAYIEYMYEHGLIEIVNHVEMEMGQPAQYRRLRSEQSLFEELGNTIGALTGAQAHR